MYHGVDKLTRETKGTSFIWSYNGNLSEDQAAEIQGFVGYHVSGYGIYNFRQGPVTTWQSSVTCD